MVRVRRSESGITYEAVTPESGVDGTIRRTMHYLGQGRKGRRSARAAEESAPDYYDICGTVSADVLEKLGAALRVGGPPGAGVSVRCRAHDPDDPHVTRLHGWADLEA
ncbi:hypothetical protein Acsp06_57950 [Actinomycetospora sp. NBRC 106375]|nr:hypothetical protein Acsp06_57950 [Actinomycetospora sp. NBRC 106375]